MENLENNMEKNKKFMQGWGFIFCIIILVTGVLIGLKILMN
jgi:hypothetical protein